MNDPSIDLQALADVAPVHFMGVGGAGMCALAELLVRHGGRVTGCDVKSSPVLDDLVAAGVDVHIGHDASHVEGASAVVMTAAVPSDHPELLRAHALGLPVLKRAEALGAWVNRGRVVAIAGTHGKTTTTAMVTEMLAEGGLNPTGLVGGRVEAWKGNLRLGGDDLFVVEADEYDRSFHTLTPDVALVTNLEADHLDVYGDLAGVEAGFAIFLSNVRDGGRVIACADDHGSASLLPGVGAAGLSYGLSAGSMLRGIDVTFHADGMSCRVLEGGRDVGPLTLELGGTHNLLNALGASAVARALGVGWPAIQRALVNFQGIGRRFERLGEAAGVVVIDDYAHHPTEIAAAIAAARGMFPERRLVVAFQPHLFSRTRDFKDAFGASLAAADDVWVTDVFPAREEPIEGVDGSLIADAVRVAGGAAVHYEPSLDAFPHSLADGLGGGDLLLTLGAGSVERVGMEVLSALGGRIHA